MLIGRGEGSKLLRDSTKKTADMGEGVVKNPENCRRRLWMVPYNCSEKPPRNKLKYSVSKIVRNIHCSNKLN